MATAPSSPPSSKEVANLSIAQAQMAIVRLKKRLGEWREAIENVAEIEDFSTLSESLCNKTNDSLVRTFGLHTIEYGRYRIHSTSFRVITPNASRQDEREFFERGYAKAVGRLQTAIQMLEEQCAEGEQNVATAKETVRGQESKMNELGLGSGPGKPDGIGARAQIERLSGIIADIGLFEPSTVTERYAPQIVALQVAIDTALADIFGHGSPDYNRYAQAARLDRARQNSLRQGVPIGEIRVGLQRGRETALEVLRTAISTLDYRGRAPARNSHRETVPRAVPNIIGSPSRTLVTPTMYSADNGHVIVVVDAAIAAMVAEKIGEVLDQLRGSNELASDTKRELTGDLKAGIEVIRSERANRSYVELLLLRPLQWIAEKFSGAAIGATANETVKAIAKAVLGS